MRYLVILEPTATGFSAYSPDLNGCAAAGLDREETIALMREAMTIHLKEMAEAGQAIPAPASEPAFIEVSRVIAVPFVRPEEVAAPIGSALQPDRVESLEGSVLRFDDPFAPAAAEDDWEACR